MTNWVPAELFKPLLLLSAVELLELAFCVWAIVCGARLVREIIG